MSGSQAAKQGQRTHLTKMTFKSSHDGAVDGGIGGLARVDSLLPSQRHNVSGVTALIESCGS